MHSPNLVLLQGDSRIAQSLSVALAGSFRVVFIATSLEELHRGIAKHRAKVAILDMEMASIPDLEKLRREFPEASIVCNHRLADWQMWAEALNAGAVDMCHSADTRSIVSAAVRSRTRALSAAA